MIEHWDGNQWNVVPSPNTPDSSALEAVSAIASDNVWAVGQGNGQPLIEHWNGSKWGIVKSQAVKGGANILQSVSAASADDILTVGEYYNPNTNPFAEHWDGFKNGRL